MFETRPSKHKFSKMSGKKAKPDLPLSPDEQLKAQQKRQMHRYNTCNREHLTTKAKKMQRFTLIVSLCLLCLPGYIVILAPRLRQLPGQSAPSNPALFNLLQTDRAVLGGAEVSRIHQSHCLQIVPAPDGWFSPGFERD